LVHTWATGGPKTVTAQGLGSACDIQVSRVITVQAPLTLSISPSSPVAGSVAQVTVEGPSPCTAVTVDFGDGTSQALTRSGPGVPMSVAHTWAAAGTKTVTATGTDGACSATATTSVSVQPPPPPPLSITVQPASPLATIPAGITIGA